jgi:hypothetical protein
MEVYNEILGILNSLQDEELIKSIALIILIQSVFFAAFFYFAVRIFRKSIEESDLSSAFYVMKKRYGIYVMEDRPYDYIK